MFVSLVAINVMAAKFLLTIVLVVLILLTGYLPQIVIVKIIGLMMETPHVNLVILDVQNASEMILLAQNAKVIID